MGPMIEVVKIALNLDVIFEDVGYSSLSQPLIQI